MALESGISVLICTRNRTEHLRRCLDSISESRRRPGEIVVVDQSTDDSTADLVSSSRYSLFPIRYYRIGSIGHTRARNIGIKVSRGEIIAFTDDDCLVDSEWLDRLWAGFTDHRVACVCGRTKPATHDDRPRQALISTLSCDRYRVFRGRCNPIGIGRGNNMAFRREDLLRLGAFNEQIGVGTHVYAGDDIDLFYRILAAGGWIVYLPEAVVHHAQPDEWGSVISKKRGYSISVAAVLGSRVRYGDVHAAMLMTGKLAYEFGWLMCGGALRLKRPLMAVGWHSLIGSLSGLKYVLDREFCAEIRRLNHFARESWGADHGHAILAEPAPYAPPE